MGRVAARGLPFLKIVENKEFMDLIQGVPRGCVHKSGFGQ